MMGDNVNASSNSSSNGIANANENNNNNNNNNKKKKRYCSVPECRCNDAAAEPLIFHRFPKDEEAKANWKSACRITKDISVHMFVCSRHFRQEDYVSELDAKVQRLKRGTVPSQNLPNDRPKLVQCELPTIAGIKRKRSNDEAILPFQSEIDSILSSMTDGKIEEIETTEILSENDLLTGVKRKCYVPHCLTKPSDERFYHYFPKNGKTMQQWIDVCELNETVKPYMSVCSAHFRADDYLIGPGSNKPILKSQAVPSLNLSDSYKLYRMETDGSTDKSSFPSSRVNAQEKADTIIYTADNANDLINFIESYNETSSDDLPNDYLEEAAADLMAVGDFELPESGLNFFEEDEVVREEQPSDPTPVENNNGVGAAKSSKGGADRIVVKKFESVNMIIQRRNGSKNIVIRRREPVQTKGINGDVSLKQQHQQQASVTALCSECGQQCRIEDDEEQTDERTTPETLAVQALLELQAINPANESEHPIFARMGLEICDRVLRKEPLPHLLDLLTGDRELRAFAGIDFQLLDKLTKLVQLYEGGNRALKRFDCARDRIVMCLCKIRTNLDFSILAKLFGIRRQLFANYFFAMTRTLSALMDKTIHWPKPDELAKSLPGHLQAFKQAKVLLSCNEMRIEKQRCQRCREFGNNNNNNNNNDCNSNCTAYNKCETVKLVLGVALSGLIIFRSSVFKDRGADGSIFSQTNVLGHLDPSREAIMTDETLNIESECAERNISLIKMPRLDESGNSAGDVEFVKNVCAANLHVNRTLQRFKTFKIVQSKICWRVLPYVNDICTIVAGVVNMTNNVIPPDESRLQLSFLR